MGISVLRLVAIVAKSVAQNQREFRQRLKEQSRYEEFKEKDKIRNRKRTALKINNSGREQLKAKKEKV